MSYGVDVADVVAAASLSLSFARRPNVDNGSDAIAHAVFHTTVQDKVNLKYARKRAPAVRVRTNTYGLASCAEAETQSKEHTLVIRSGCCCARQQQLNEPLPSRRRCNVRQLHLHTVMVWLFCACFSGILCGGVGQVAETVWQQQQHQDTMRFGFCGV